MKNTLDARISALLADPLRAARLAADSGRRVIGYVGPDVPVELILAADALPVRVSGKSGMATPRADSFMERAFMPEMRSIAEQWVSRELDFIDSIVLPRSDDSAQRLYYYMCELQRLGRCAGPKPIIHDVAAINRPTSVGHTIAATLKLAREIGARERSLPRAIGEVAEHMHALRQVASIQQGDSPLYGSVALRLARCLHSCWDAPFRRELQASFAGLARAQMERRILLVGNAPPDDRLHRAMEKSRATVVRELTDANWFADRPSPEAAVQSFEDIGRRAHARASLSQRLARSEDAILEAAQGARAHGVVIWMIEEETSLGWELPAQLATLKRAGIPALVLTRQPWEADSGVLRALEDFCAELGEPQ